MTGPSDVLTVSSSTTFQLCRQKYCWRYERALRPEKDVDSEALTLGKAFHCGMDAKDVDRGLGNVGIILTQALSLAGLPEEFFKLGEIEGKTRAMVRAAWEKWPQGAGTNELRFERPIVNPDTQGTSRSFSWCGRVDRLEDKHLIDWKSTADARKFIQEKRIGYQLPGYLYGLAEQHEGLDSIIYRLIEKPTLRRGGITKTRTEPEPVEDFEERCYLWLAEGDHLIEEKIPLTNASLDAFQRYLWGLTKDILWSRTTGHWSRNTIACYTWSRECEYMPLCQQLADGTALDDVRTDGFVQGDPHPELEE